MAGERAQPRADREADLPRRVRAGTDDPSADPVAPEETDNILVTVAYRVVGEPVVSAQLPFERCSKFAERCTTCRTFACQCFVRGRPRRSHSALTAE
jgi:hypothetical protein